MLENPFSQVHHHTTKRSSSATNAGLSANLLNYLESFLKHAVQRAARKPGAKSEFVGSLHLACNLSLAKHHGVQTSSNAQQVASGVEIFVDIGVWTEIARLDAK